MLAILLGAMLGAVMLTAWGLAPPLVLAGASVLLATLALAHDAPRERIAAT